MDEFNLIKKYFTPLAAAYSGSLNLTDDAALVDVPAGKQLVITKDAISEGRHFLGSEDPLLIAKKLLRVNLSDLASMGASPLCYFLAVMLPKTIDESWVARFATGLFEDQRRYGVSLAGGDTIAVDGPLTFSITAIGTVENGKALRRSGAKAGDKIYVSGTIGDSALGLRNLREHEPLAPMKPGESLDHWLAASPSVASDSEEKHFLIRRYLLPEPHIALGRKLHGIAHACMDVSDGLVQDLSHICAASKMGAKIHRHLIPLSKPARAMIEKNPALWDSITGGGDDYELLFTVPAMKEHLLASIISELELPLACIGEMYSGEGVTMLDENKKPLAPAKGFSHF
jgi:thiamine-monophosphate kinase